MVSPRQFRKMNIILAVDGSDHSMAATRFLYDLPLPDGSTITILAVLIPRDASGHAALESALEQAKEMIAGKSVGVTAELLTGYPAEELTQYADQHHPDLMVLGAKGLRATLGIMLGGVVQQVVEYATWPVVVVRAPYLATKRVLLITDGSRYSQHALEYLRDLTPRVLRFASCTSCLLSSPAYIARTWPVGSETVSPLPSYETEKLLSRQAEEEERGGQSLLDQTIKMMQGYGVEATSVLLRGDAATEIIEYVKTHQIDLIIAGARGLSPMSALARKSHSLIHYACSVLVVKGGDHVTD
jgi:nucleotide-binding universal stress UspA family protein